MYMIPISYKFVQNKYNLHSFLIYRTLWTTRLNWLQLASEKMMPKTTYRFGRIGTNIYGTIHCKSLVTADSN